jgi:Undecaprenyl-phosphate glucose phosphotransferase
VTEKPEELLSNHHPLPEGELSSLDDTTLHTGKETLRFTSNVFGSLVLLTDVAAFLVSAPIALLIYELVRQSPVVPTVHILAFVLMLGGFLTIRSSRNAYRKSLVERSEGYSVAAFDAAISALIASALIWQAGLIQDYSRGLTLIFVVSVVSCLALSRPLLRRLVNRLAKGGQIEQRVVFYGADAETIGLTKRSIESLRFEHLHFVGVADDRGIGDDIDDLPMIGGLSNLCDLARRGEVDQVFIIGSRYTGERLAQIVEGLSEVCVDVSLVPVEAIKLSPNYAVNLLGNMPVLTLWQRPVRDVNRILKRAEDLLISIIALVILSPILLLTAVVVRLSSPGPALFIQPRVGFNNEVIRVFKFRTMYTDLADLGARKTTTRDDPRITWVGRILRRTSIDELPQLLNVLQGSMSLVGPRPHAMEMMVGDRYYHEAVRGYSGRHRVKPGITGLAQVNGLRGEVRTMERAKRRIELDKQYVDNWSLWLDLSILISTPRAALFDRDAY